MIAIQAPDKCNSLQIQVGRDNGYLRAIKPCRIGKRITAELEESGGDGKLIRLVDSDGTGCLPVVDLMQRIADGCFFLAQFANCVLALCVIDEIVINSMTIGKIMKIRPPVS